MVALRVWAPGWVEMEWFASAVNAVVGSESDEEPPPHVEGAIEAEADGDRQSELQPEPEPQDAWGFGGALSGLDQFSKAAAAATAAAAAQAREIAKQAGADEIIDA